MPLTGEYEPSPVDWVNDQVARYEATDGKEGNTYLDLPVVIMSNLGAKSGRVRKNPVMRIEHEGTYAVAASNGGGDTHPGWYFNLLANPRVEIQDGPVKRGYIARELQGEEKQLWWTRADAAYPYFADYRAGTAREIPLFVLEPADGE